MRTSRSLVWFAILAGIVSGVANSGLIALIHSSLNGNTNGTSFALGFAVLCAVALLTRVASEVVLVRLTQGTIFDLRLRLCRKVLSAPLRRLEEIGPHSILVTLNDDILAVTNALSGLPVLCINAVIIAGCLGYLWWLSWRTLLVVLVFLAIAIASYQLLMSFALKSLRAGREDHDSLYRHFYSLTHGSKELKLHGGRRRAFVSELLRPTAGSLRDHNVRATSMMSVASSWGQLLFFVFIGLLLFNAFGMREMNSQTLSGYPLTVLFMMGPLGMVLGSFSVIGRANDALRKVESLGLSLEDGAEESEEAAGERSKPEWESLELRGVTHVYYREKEDSRFVLGPIDLRVGAGELLFITGGNGSGKTTLAKLLTGLYVPEGGEVVVDGEAVTDETREAYRQQFTAVFSDYFLFDRLLGLEVGGKEGEVARYLEELQLDKKVEIREGMLSTTELSQGQRKRLALLTAYLEDRPVYVFDEWAAEQDVLFREVFYREILPELKGRGKTVVVISHDERYYGVADRVVKLDYGQIVSDLPAHLALEEASYDAAFSLPFTTTPSPTLLDV
jgi:putative ATP-binding cassette transporter